MFAILISPRRQTTGMVWPVPYTENNDCYCQIASLKRLVLLAGGKQYYGVLASAALFTYGGVSRTLWLQRSQKLRGINTCIINVGRIKTGDLLEFLE